MAETTIAAEPTRRDFLYIATGTAAAVGAASLIWPFVSSMAPDAHTVAAGAPVEVDLYAEPNEIRTPIVTLYDLGEGPHTLTIEVTGTWNAKADTTQRIPFVTVDAFDVEPQLVSRFQEMDPDVTLAGSWTQDDSGTWSGGGVHSGLDPSFGGMRYTMTPGDKATVKFRGTAIAWNGYRGPDGGTAIVRIDGGEPKVVDTYFAKFKAQEEVFKASGLANTTHTMTIAMTTQVNPLAVGPVRIVVDSFEVTRPGRRYQERDPAIAYTGQWHRDNDNRPWSEGRVFTSEFPGASVEFTFTGTSVSWISAQKRSLGKSRVFLDGTLVGEVNNKRAEPIEGYQREVFRRDKLSPGQHKLRIEPLGGGYTVVDAFDVHPAEPAPVTTPATAPQPASK